MIAALLLACLAMLLTALGDKRHDRGRRAALRLGAVLAHAGSLGAAIAALGWGIGIVAWLMALSVGAVVAVAWRTLRRAR